MEKDRTLLLEVELETKHPVFLPQPFVAEMFDDGSTDVIVNTYDHIEDELIPVRRTYKNTHFCKYVLVRETDSDQTILETYSSLEEIKKAYAGLSSEDKKNLNSKVLLLDADEDEIAEVELVL